MGNPTGAAPIGGDTTRIDALQRVTGEAKFVEDLPLTGLLHARVLRSPHVHARLLSLAVDAAAGLPGVVRVITASDVPGVNGYPEYSRDEPLLTPVGETLKMKGAPIALVVGDSPQAARAGLEALRAEYEVLPHSFEIEPKDPPVYPGGDRLNEHQVTQADADGTLAASEVVVESRYTTCYQEHSALERESALGFLDEVGRVTVMGGTHEPHWQRKWIAAALALPLERVRFITPPTGGSFGGKQDPWPLVAAGLMTFLTGKPVRLVFSRLESFEASPKRHPYHMHFQIGANRNGKLTAIRARMDANTGAYDSAGYFIPEYAVMAAGGPYLWEAADIHAQTIYSNGPKCGQYRGFGTPQPTFGLECTLDEVIQQLGADPIQFRLDNKIEQSSRTFLGYPVAESLGFTEVLEALRPRYKEFQRRASAFNTRSQATGSPYRAGVGLAGMWYRFGKSGSLRIEAHAELGLDGRFLVYCSAPEYGQGIGTVMTQLAAQALGLPRDMFDLVNADTARTPDSDVQGASRATYWVGSAVVQAVETLKAELLGVAAEMIDSDPDQLVLKADCVRHTTRRSRKVALVEVAREFERLGKSRKVRGFFDLSQSYPEHNRPKYTPHFVTAAHLAEVQVDMETGQSRVARYVAVHDVGRVINPSGAQGQVEGAVLMGLGTALSEAYFPGITTGLSDYILPLVSDIPEIEVVLVEVPGYLGPLGAKGLGEAAMLPSTPAIINALSRAIGVRIRQVPATPERVLGAIQGLVT
jgi:CO/xanthine dehydrogenase Mo-binding subunit